MSRRAPRPHWHIPQDITKAVSLKEAAKLLNYHPKTLVERSKKGKFPHCFKIGSRWFCDIQ